MTTPAQIKAYAATYGVEFSSARNGRAWNLECWSPEGKRFTASGTHFYALYGDNFYDKPDWNKTLADLKETISYGFEDCDDEECDVCNPID